MRSPHGWTKASKRGSAYSHSDGRFWIKKVGGSWILLQMGSEAEGREKKVFGNFPTLTAAVDYFNQLEREARA